ncbi:MAG: PIN domain-containing protein [Longimicrobiales bacterium]
MTSIAVTDTHALVWYAMGRRRKLGARARRVFEAADAGTAAIWVPVLVLVEVAELARRGVLSLSGGFDGWASGLFATGRFFPAELTLGVVSRAESLYGIAERTDRLIAATAASLGYPLLTRDARIREANVVPTIW